VASIAVLLGWHILALALDAAAPNRKPFKLRTPRQLS